MSLSFAAFLLGMAFSQAARTMSMVQIPVFLRELGADIGDVGLFFTLSMVFPLALRVVGGWLSDSIGRLRAITLGTLAGVVGFLVFAVSPIWELSLAAPFFLAVATSLSAPSFKAFIADHAPEDQRGRIFGLAEAATTAAWIVGPPIGGVLAQYLGYRWMLVSSAATFGVSFLIFLILTLSRPQTRREPLEWPRLSSLRSSLGEMIGLLLAGGLVTWLLITDGVRDIAFELSFDLMPVYLRDIMGIDKQSIGALDGIYGLALTVASYPAGWLVDKASERLGVVLGLIAVILSRLVFSVVDSFWGFAFSWVLLGIGAGLLDPAYSSLIAKGVPQRFRGVAYGLMATSLGIISLPSPWIGSQIWEQFGPKVPFVLTAVLGAIALIPAWVKLVVPVSAEGEAGITRPVPAHPFKSPLSSGVVATSRGAGDTARSTGTRSEEQGRPSAAESPKVAPFTTGSSNAYVTVLTGLIEGLLSATQSDPSRIFPRIAAIVHKYRGTFQAQGADGFVAVFGSESPPTRPQINALLATQAALDAADLLQSVAAQSTGGPRSIRLSMGIATGPPEPSGTLKQTADRLQRMAMRAETAPLLICGETYRFLANVRGEFSFGRFGKAPGQMGQGEVMLYEVLGRRPIHTKGPPSS